MHRERPDPPPPLAPRDVDGELGDARVAFAGPVAERRGEADDAAVAVLDDDDGMGAVEPGAHVLFGAGLRLERGDAIGDPLAVNPSDGRGISGGRRAGAHAPKVLDSGGRSRHEPHALTQLGRRRYAEMMVAKLLSTSWSASCFAPLLSIALASFAACGSPPPPQAPTPPTPSDTTSSTAAGPSTASDTSKDAAATPASGGSTASATAPADEDPSESSGPIVMSLELSKSTPKSSFPKRTVDDKTCWQTISLSGDSRKDYETIATACGSPTGLLEYVKPATGHLHSTNDKRDDFRVKLLKGWCYRYIAVGDAGIADLDILVEKPGGALVADDKQTSPVAIIESEKTWCMDEDADYDFHIQVDGSGSGKYVFGVWGRPKS